MRSCLPWGRTEPSTLRRWCWQKCSRLGWKRFLQKASRKLNSNSRAVCAANCARPVGGGAGGGHPLLVYVNNDLLIASPDVAELQQAAMRARQQGTAGQFATTPFYQQIVHSYQQGAEWLFCADMEQIVAKHVQDDSGGMSAAGDE